jgi:hypothetical protein
LKDAVFGVSKKLKVEVDPNQRALFSALSLAAVCPVSFVGSFEASALCAVAHPFYALVVTVNLSVNGCSGTVKLLARATTLARNKASKLALLFCPFHAMSRSACT